MYSYYIFLFEQLEAIPESLKNMLLVMDTAGIFQTGDGVESKLWKLTWDRIDTFLPNLKNELFKPREQGKFITCTRGTFHSLICAIIYLGKTIG